MFNTPILDVAIGLAFIFLLYSFLITAISEAIATTFGLRAKMLKRGIVNGMLSDTPEYGEWKGVFYSIRYYFKEFFALFRKEKKPKTKNKLGQKFYEHPMIRNYGSNEIYPHPSYIPKHNFSSVLIDVLKSEFELKSSAIAQKKGITKVALQQLNELEKIKSLLDYYADLHLANCINNKDRKTNLFIDKDTLVMIRMQLDKCNSSITELETHLENWFDDSMHRVSGWYKRQTQFILIALALLTAVIFNVDTIEIAGKLSKDKNLREQLVQSATAYAQSHTKPSGEPASPSDSVTIKEVQAKWKKVDSLINHDIKDVNSLLALGWGDYGAKKNEQAIIGKYSQEYLKNFESIAGKDKIQAYKDITKVRKWIFQNIYEKHWVSLKVCYVLKESTRAKKFLGFLITAMAISLGSPFWFDLLSKLINLRGSGKKENGDQNNPEKSGQTSEIKISVNKDSEAVG